jgi:hypothetical protein
VARRSLEDLLLEGGLCDEAALRAARHRARHAGVSLACAVVDAGLVDDAALAELLALRLGLPSVELTDEPVEDDALREVPHDLAESRGLLPLTVQRGGARPVIRVAMADPLDRDALEEIELSTGCFVEPLVARERDLAAAVARHYRRVITRMIPRRTPFGTPAGERTRAAEPSTQPTHLVADEASPEVRLAALVELLVERGVFDRETFLEAVRRMVKQNAGE